MSTETPEIRLLRTQEVADRLALSNAQVRELMRTGRLDSVKIDSSRRVRSDVLDAFIKGLASDAAGAA